MTITRVKDGPCRGKVEGGIRRARGASVAIAIIGSLASAASAGPPYVTDDPEPTRVGGWENYAYVTGTNTPGETAGQGGLELNYGAARDLQLSLSIPLAYESQHVLRASAGDLDFGVKYRFLHPGDGGWLPDVAVFPAVTVPTAARAFDTSHPTVFLPVWLEKDVGPWSVFGGGGFDLNPGRDARNFALFGWAVTRSVTRRLNLGVEVYHQTAATVAGAGVTNLGVGATYQLTRHWALMASGGPGLETPSRSGASAFYASLQFTN